MSHLVIKIALFEVYVWPHEHHLGSPPYLCIKNENMAHLHVAILTELDVRFVSFPHNNKSKTIVIE